MKRYVKLFSLFIFAAVLFTSCQKEESEFIDENPGGTITADSQLKKLLQQTAKNSTTSDDFIDGNSCSSIQLPFQVIVNGQTVTIQNQTALNALASSNTPVQIVFPVTVVFEDFSTVQVQSQQALNALNAQCDLIEEAIECIDLVYPVTFFTFNSDDEQTGTVVVQNDAQLFAFLTGLGQDDYITIDYSITVVLANGSTVEVFNNDQLEDLIDNCQDSVPQDPGPGDLQSILTSQPWYVSFFFDDQEETYLFAGYEFNFNANGSATASNGTTSISGNWAVIVTGQDQLKLDLDFGNTDPFDELEDDWNVIQFNSELIQLFDVSGGDGSTNYLSFSSTPPQTGGSAQSLINILSDGTWFIDSYLDGNDDETLNFNTFTFTFNANSTVSVSNTLTTLNGTWSVVGSTNLKLILNFNNVFPLDELSDDWDVFDVQNNRVELRDVSGGSGELDVLVFKKN